MSQLALIYESDPKQQTVQSHPIPEPMEGFVQVRVEAAAFNPLDYKIYDRGTFVQKYPTILGVDAAGEVTKIGPGVTKFKVGDRVTCLCTPNFPQGAGIGERGAFQQYTLADVRITAKIPENADYEPAASFPVAGNTAAGALYGQLKFKDPWLGGEGAYRGEKNRHFGGSSSVGAYTIQLALLSGLQVITTASAAHFDYLKSLGVATVIDRSAPDVPAQILAAAGGPVKYVVDCISLQQTQLLAVEILQPEGKLVLVLSPNPSAQSAAEAKNITLLGTNGPANFYFSEPFWDAVGGYMERGTIKFNRPMVLSGGLRSWVEAFDLHRQGKVSGIKIVMRPQETK
ncbi:GroES-like protein [Mycena sanguinolenta]|uniref:GroES-like protein n=1 Tax=Mycena sanguinolenta TaxID=230812 RepID=A0A8H6YSV0_9AGAR|nr:GroES-like protein [Mycena sanguinolenta]